MALQALRVYDWPGNVRELERLMERAVALATGDVIDLDDLPPIVGGDYGDILLPSFKRNDTLRVWACRYTRLMLDRCHGNKRAAARVLGISYHTLTTYLKFKDPVVPRGEDENGLPGDAGPDSEIEPASVTGELQS